MIIGADAASAQNQGGLQQLSDTQVLPVDLALSARGVTDAHGTKRGQKAIGIPKRAFPISTPSAFVGNGDERGGLLRGIRWYA